MYFFSLKIDVGKPYREGGFILCHGCAAPQAGPTSWGSSGEGCAGWRAAAALREPSGRAEDRAVLPYPLFLPFPAELQRQSTELSVNRKKDFFSPSCIRKQSDLAVLVICLQLSWLRCTSQEMNIFLINFPVTFYRCCKLHWSYPSSVHCGCQAVTELSPFM